MRELMQKQELVIYEDDIALAVLHDKPAVKGHIIVFPKKEAKEMNDLSAEDNLHLFYVSSFAATVLFETMGCHGTNIISRDDGEFFIEVIARMQDDDINFQWSPKQISDMEAVKSAISSKVIFEEKPKDPPKMEKVNEEDKPDEEDYRIKHLTKIA